ncbi:MAG: G8 domain-containing protein [Kiritimatiellae bacterium]|nr:G8 domain-containing protein [Kiritimatiellia bacterium]
MKDRALCVVRRAVFVADDTVIGFSPNNSRSVNSLSKTKGVTTTVGTHTFSCTQANTNWAVYVDNLAPATGTVTTTASPSTAHGTALNGDYYKDMGLDGCYYAVRFYNRALTAHEVAINHAVDQVRYFGVDSDSITLPSGWRFTKDGGLRLEHTASISVSSEGAGEVVGEDGETPMTTFWCEQNGTARLTLTAKPAEGYVFLGWQCDGLTDNQKVCPTLTADFAGDVIARFRKTDGSEPLDYTWVGGAGASWDDRLSWNDAGGVPGVPQANDSVTIPSGKTVTLTNTTPVYSILTVAGTLATTNWTTCVRAGMVLIKRNGKVTVKTASTDAATNRVWIACGGLTIETGGTINVNTLGYLGKNGLGWIGVTHSGAGAHGGGRIAIWYDIDETDAAFKERVVAKGGVDSAAPEDVQEWYNGENGTVYWKPKTGLRVLVR